MYVQFMSEHKTFFLCGYVKMFQYLCSILSSMCCINVRAINTGHQVHCSHVTNIDPGYDDILFVCLFSSYVILISQMPLLETHLLQGHRELRLAHLTLSVMTMGYVWQEGENDTVKVCHLSLCKVVYMLSSKRKRNVLDSDSERFGRCGKYPTNGKLILCYA